MVAGVVGSNFGCDDCDYWSRVVGLGFGSFGGDDCDR